jgi:Mce-associated membrane protein
MPRFVPRALRGQAQRGQAQRARGAEARHLTTKANNASPTKVTTTKVVEPEVEKPPEVEVPRRRPSPRPRPTPSPAPDESTDQDTAPATRRAPIVKAPARPGGKKKTSKGKSAARRDDRRPVGRRKQQARRAAIRLARLHRAVLVLAVLVVVVGLGVLALAGAAGLARLPLVSGTISDSARNDALASANAAAPALLSYDYRTFDASIDKGRRYVTGPFAKQYASTTKSLKANAVKEHAVVSAQVSSSGVVSASPTEVVVLLYVNQYRQNSNITGQKVDQNRVVMTMVPVGDQWKVSKVTAI